LIERLEFFAVEPDLLLDVGAGTGFASQLLQKYYKKSSILALDLAINMLFQARLRCATRFRSPFNFVCGDAESLPVVDSSIDMIFSNLTLQWCQNLNLVFQEFRRVLKPGGVLVFTTFGPDTLVELRESWSRVDDTVHVNSFPDIHDVGDAMIQAGFSGPVLDAERITLTYPDIYRLMRDLKKIGAHNVNDGRRRGLTGKSQLEELEKSYENYRTGQTLPATYEVVYAHGWAPFPKTRPQDGSTVATFPFSRLKRFSRDRS
jgi:malonyl-CoA O-methyltransferase